MKSSLNHFLYSPLSETITPEICNLIHVEKNKEFVVDTFYCEELPAGQLKLNQSYCDQSLEKLRQRHKELLMLNRQLKQIAGELLKEN